MLLFGSTSFRLRLPRQRLETWNSPFQTAPKCKLQLPARQKQGLQHRRIIFTQCLSEKKNKKALHPRNLREKTWNHLQIGMFQGSLNSNPIWLHDFVVRFQRVRSLVQDFVQLPGGRPTVRARGAACPRPRPAVSWQRDAAVSAPWRLGQHGQKMWKNMGKIRGRWPFSFDFHGSWG